MTGGEIKREEESTDFTDDADLSLSSICVICEICGFPLLGYYRKGVSDVFGVW